MNDNDYSTTQQRYAGHLDNGLTKEEIATMEGRSVNTIKTQVHRMYDKAGVTNKTAFLKKFFKRE